MKKAFAVAFLMFGLAMALLAFVNGCQHTPRQRVSDARATYVTVLHEINTLHSVGQITVAQKRQLAPATQSVASILDTADVLAASGDVSGADQAIDAANQILDAALRDAGFDPVTLKRK